MIQIIFYKIETKAPFLKPEVVMFMIPYAYIITYAVIIFPYTCKKNFPYKEITFTSSQICLHFL